MSLTPSVLSQWLQGVISLQCSIVKHLSARKPHWNSVQTEDADVKPILSSVSEDEKLRSLHKPDFQTESKPCSTTSDLQGAAVVKPVGVVEKQMRGTQCSSCTERPCRNCGTTNGPVERECQSNGKQQQHQQQQQQPQKQQDLTQSQKDVHQHKWSDPAGPDTTRCPPHGTTTTITANLPNHASTGAIVKMEQSACTAPPGKDSAPSQPPSLTSNETSSTTVSPPQRPVQEEEGRPKPELTNRVWSSPTAGTRAITPPEASLVVCVPTPPSGTRTPQRDSTRHHTADRQHSPSHRHHTLCLQSVVRNGRGWFSSYPSKPAFDEWWLNTC